MRGGERVRVPCVTVGRVRSPSQELAHSSSDAPQHVPDLVLGRARQGDETDALFLFDKDAVRNEAMEVHVEVECTAEPLHEGDCAGSRRLRVSPAAAAALHREDRAQRQIECASDLRRPPNRLGGSF